MNGRIAAKFVYILGQTKGRMARNTRHAIVYRSEVDFLEFRRKTSNTQTNVTRVTLFELRYSSTVIRVPLFVVELLVIRVTNCYSFFPSYQ